jgi:hypothetical protein
VNTRESYLTGYREPADDTQHFVSFDCPSCKSAVDTYAFDTMETQRLTCDDCKVRVSFIFQPDSSYYVSTWVTEEGEE